MKILDFNYDNKRLSDFDCMMCHFDGDSSDTKPVETVTFNTIKQTSSSKYNIYSHQSEFLQTTLQICKNPCYQLNSPEFTVNEIRDITLWLRKNDYREFYFLDSMADEIYLYEVVFTSISTIKRGGKVVGFELTINTSEPYARTDMIETNYEFTDITNEFYIANDGDEYGYIYPEKVIFEIKQDGDLKFINMPDEYETIIKNCVQDEVITLDCKNMTLESTIEGHKLYNDFNYHFPKLIRNEDDYGNTFISSLLVNVTMQYKLIRKVGIQC